MTAKHGTTSPKAYISNLKKIRTRAKRGKLKGGNRGNTTPMIEIEPYLVDMIGQLANMRAPINCKQGLALANSLIKDTSHEEKVNAWKQKHNYSYQKQNGNAATLGQGYWK
jgi:hypothetical protein